MNEVSFGSKVWGSDEGFESTDGPAASLEDAADFRRHLQAKPQVPEADTPSLGSILNQFTGSQHDVQQRFDKSLKRVNRTGDPVEMLKVQENLSHMYTNHSLAVKVIGKATSALDSLMRLQ